MTDKEQALYILSKCRAMTAEDELKMISLSLRYWEDGHPPDVSVAMAAEFILNKETKTNGTD